MLVLCNCAAVEKCEREKDCHREAARVVELGKCLVYGGHVRERERLSQRGLVYGGHVDLQELTLYRENFIKRFNNAAN